jgi:hypothetical protein
VVAGSNPAAGCCCCALSQGFAYIEFLEADAVDNAIMLDNSELRGRQIKVRAWKISW